MPLSADPTESYLEALLAGDTPALLAAFAAEPAVDDPLGGRVRGEADFRRFAAERHAWLAERSARVDPLRATRATGRTVFETLVHLCLPESPVELPVAVVGVHAPQGGLSDVRVYHSLWPLIGSHRVRPPLLPADPAAHVTGAVAEYQQALAAGDVEAIVGTFEPDGYFREPAGGEYLYRGREKLHEFMTYILSPGGIGLEHCAITDDGVACALEFNAVRFGPNAITPQAGVAVYERGPSGRLHAARIYDDVNVEALAGPS